MNNKKLYIALFAIFCFLACSPVRTQYFKERTNTSASESAEVQSAEKKEDNASSEQLRSLRNRFYDTTTIIIPANVQGNRSSALNKQFQIAMSEFDREEYNNACPKFKSLASTLLPEDSLAFESRFYLCECAIIRDELEIAGQNLNLLLNDKMSPLSVTEKVLVRLGQLYCVMDRKNEAEVLFQKLKTDYPKSVYLPIANCDAVKK